MAGLLLDHNVSPRLGIYLGRHGHQVTTAWGAGLHRADDTVLLALAARTGLILISHDRDFIALHGARRHNHAGILVLAQFPQEQAAVVGRSVMEALGAGLPGENGCYAWEEQAGWVRQP